MGRKGIDPRRMKKWKRLVLNVFVSPEKTSRGNPKFYEFMLECGHTVFKYHCANTSVHVFTFVKKLGEVVLYCHSCFLGFSQAPKCEKQPDMPINFMPRHECRDCEKDDECTMTYREWEEFRKTERASK